MNTAPMATHWQERERIRPSVSVVIPCLNERETIGEVVREAGSAFGGWQGGSEVIVADNGSTDGSVAIALASGARVVRAVQQGYGAALQAGFAAARAPYIVYGDADLTYDFHEGPALVMALSEQNADMALGTRLRGRIEPGAMPILHRCVGTPILTLLINRLYGGQLTDCNSGLRAIRRDRLATWGATSPGMEFASEIIVNALGSAAKIVEVPITLRRQRATRRRHLRTWRDGMRHFLTILARAPWLFVNAGLAIIVVSALVAFACGFGRRLVFETFVVFDYHTLILATLVGFLGSQILGTGLVLQLRRPAAGGRVATTLLELNEGALFWLLLGITVAVLGGVGFVAIDWARHGFANIAHLRLKLFTLHLATVIGAFGMCVFHAHLLKRA